MVYTILLVSGLFIVNHVDIVISIEMFDSLKILINEQLINTKGKSHCCPVNMRWVLKLKIYVSASWLYYFYCNYIISFKTRYFMNDYIEYYNLPAWWKLLIDRIYDSSIFAAATAVTAHVTIIPNNNNNNMSVLVTYRPQVMVSG